MPLFKDLFGKRLKEPEREHFIKRIDYQREVSAKGIKHFDMGLICAHVVIIGDDSDKISVQAQWADRSQRFTAEVSLDKLGDKVCLRIEDLVGLVGKDPSILVVKLPRTINIAVNVTGGTLFADQVSGDFDVNMKTGSISGKVFSKKAQVKLDAGAINLHHLQGSADVKTNVGDVIVSFDRLEADDKVDIEAGLGNVKAYFPAGFLNKNAENDTQQLKNSLSIPARVHAGLGTVKCTVSKPAEKYLKSSFLAVDPMLFTSIVSAVPKLLSLATKQTFALQTGFNNIVEFNKQGKTNYQMLMPRYLYQVPGAVFAFASYETLKKSLTDYCSLSQNMSGLMSSWLTGLTASFLITPFQNGELNRRNYSGLFPSYFSGFLPNALRFSIQAPILLAGTDYLKSMAHEYGSKSNSSTIRHVSNPNNNYSAFIAAFLTGTFSQLLLAPFEAIRKQSLNFNGLESPSFWRHSIKAFNERKLFQFNSCGAMKMGTQISLMLGLMHLIKTKMHLSQDSHESNDQEKRDYVPRR